MSPDVPISVSILGLFPRPPQVRHWLAVRLRLIAWNPRCMKIHPFSPVYPDVQPCATQLRGPVATAPRDVRHPPRDVRHQQLHFPSRPSNTPGMSRGNTAATHSCPSVSTHPVLGNLARRCCRCALRLPRECLPKLSLPLSETASRGF